MKFTASQDLLLHAKDEKPCPNVEGAEPVLVKKGEAIPEIFVPLFLKHNLNLIGNIEYENGNPKLSKEVREKYLIEEPKILTKMELPPIGFSQEQLTVKLNKMGAKAFKEWSEKEFGKDNIDKRKNAKTIIVDILRIQGERRR